jgi:hypothetical protein
MRETIKAMSSRLLLATVLLVAGPLFVQDGTPFWE